MSQGLEYTQHLFSPSWFHFSLYCPYRSLLQLKTRNLHIWCQDLETIRNRQHLFFQAQVNLFIVVLPSSFHFPANYIISFSFTLDWKSMYTRIINCHPLVPVLMRGPVWSEWDNDACSRAQPCSHEELSSSVCCSVIWWGFGLLVI